MAGSLVHTTVEYRPQRVSRLILCYVFMHSLANILAACPSITSSTTKDLTINHKRLSIIRGYNNNLAKNRGHHGRENDLAKIRGQKTDEKTT